MSEIKEIAVELSKGNIERASEIKMNVRFEDEALELEAVEVVRQAMIGYLKQGEIEKAHKTWTLFALPEDVAEEVLKQAILSVYYAGNLKLVIDIRNKMPLSQSVREELVEYCESWGRHEEAKVMRTAFLV